MNYYLYKLIPPRPTFIHDVTPDEAKQMNAHAAYWMKFVEKGTVIVMGPVDDPKGAWGMGVAQVSSREELEALIQNDPVVKGELAFTYEIYSMPGAIHKP